MQAKIKEGVRSSALRVIAVIGKAKPPGIADIAVVARSSPRSEMGNRHRKGRKGEPGATHDRGAQAIET